MNKKEKMVLVLMIGVMIFSIFTMISNVQRCDRENNKQCSLYELHNK